MVVATGFVNLSAPMIGMATLLQFRWFEKIIAQNTVNKRYWNRL